MDHVKRASNMETVRLIAEETWEDIAEGPVVACAGSRYHDILY